jgi:hypothetical protein
MSNVEITGVQTAQEALQQVAAVDAVLFGINQTDAVVQIISKSFAVLDANNVASGGFNGLVNSIDQLLGLAGALQAHNYMNHRNFLLCYATYLAYGHSNSLRRILQLLFVNL